MNEKSIDLNNDIYKALGHFVVEFSRLLHSLETSTSHLICPQPNGTMILIRTALADRTASPIITSFFSVFFKRWEGFIVEKDEKILKTLRKELDEIVKIRNRLMHDVWFCNFGQDSSDLDGLYLQRLRAHGKGANFQTNHYSTSKINELTSDANRLSHIINNIVWYHPPEPNILELYLRFKIIDNKVIEI